MTCIHHYVIQLPEETIAQETQTGTCKKCGKVQVYLKDPSDRWTRFNQPLPGARNTQRTVR